MNVFMLAPVTIILTDNKHTRRQQKVYEQSRYNGVELLSLRFWICFLYVVLEAH